MRSRSFLLLIASTLFALIVAEASAGLILHSKLSVTLFSPQRLNKLQSIYANWTRHIVQFETACTQFDAEVFYILRPGECRFQNVEFDTVVRVNSVGFR